VGRGRDGEDVHGRTWRGRPSPPPQAAARTRANAPEERGGVHAGVHGHGRSTWY
jgi:hypothetical protein